MLPCLHLDAFIISCPISLNMLHLLVPYNQNLTVVIFASFLVEDKCKKNLHPASSVHFFPCGYDTSNIVIWPGQNFEDV